jgi:hypothetical protein
VLKVKSAFDLGKFKSVLDHGKLEIVCGPDLHLLATGALFLVITNVYAQQQAA